MSREINILKTVVNIGVSEPFKILHITDTHLIRDNATGLNRQKAFEKENTGCIEDYFFQAIAYAKENSMPILCTGDIVDFLSKGNLDFIDRYFSDVDYIFAAGNHDFCYSWVGVTEDYAYKWGNIKDIAPHIKSNLYFDSRLIGGVNIVTLDNSYYLISEGQLEMLKAEVAKGYPIILGVHVPLYGEEQANQRLGNGSSCTFLCGCPEEVLDRYTSERRRKQQTPDEETLRAVEYIKSEPLIKAIISGHTHANFEEKVAENLMQYTTHGTFAGYAREITVM